MKLVFTPEAEEQADECDRWWREHRDAKDIFARELAGTRTLLREAPNIGSMYTVLDGLPVRRVLLRKTRTHVYYSVDGDAELVTVLAVWGAPKGRAPKL
jgi:plasmid stabilization system protein ParE